MNKPNRSRNTLIIASMIGGAAAGFALVASRGERIPSPEPSRSSPVRAEIGQGTASSVRGAGAARITARAIRVPAEPVAFIPASLYLSSADAAAMEPAGHSARPSDEMAIAQPRPALPVLEIEGQGDRVLVWWDATPESDVSGYNVYRSLDGVTFGEPINEAPLVIGCFLDGPFAQDCRPVYAIEAVPTRVSDPTTLASAR